VTVRTLAIDLRTVALPNVRKWKEKVFRTRCLRWVHSGEFRGTSTSDFLNSKGGKFLLEVFELFRQLDLGLSAELTCFGRFGRLRRISGRKSRTIFINPSIAIKAGWGRQSQMEDGYKSQEEKDKGEWGGRRGHTMLMADSCWKSAKGFAVMRT
jgi:hypothetical protein